MFARLADHPIPLLVLILLVVVLFGWKRLPDAARSLGRSSRILKSEIDEMKAESAKSKASSETVQGEARPAPTTTAGSTTTTAGATPVDEVRTESERRTDGI